MPQQANLNQIPSYGFMLDVLVPVVPRSYSLGLTAGAVLEHIRDGVLAEINAAYGLNKEEGLQQHQILGVPSMTPQEMSSPYRETIITLFQVKREHAGDIRRRIENKRAQDITQLWAEIRELKTTINTLQGQISYLEDRSVKDKIEQENLKKEIQSNSESIRAMRRLHARVILDDARKKVAKELGYEDWDRMCEAHWHSNATVAYSLFNLRSLPVAQMLMQATDRSVCGLSQDTISYLCFPNDARRTGNDAAHSANPEQMKEAVLLFPRGSRGRQCLGELYEYLHGEKVE
ncbi:hypothetical protein AX17_007441 [Amanita inopinata Kibby_2008]|nr:hypothetical protein AX17_007441 [Amanita inopinata Kibby_2008]